jgi:hemoglobin
MAPADSLSTPVPDAAASPAPGSFYEAVGGSGALREAVDRFYARILADPSLNARFEGVDLARLKRHQALLLAQVLGGPADYDGRSLADAHAGMDISLGEYTRVGEHLTGVLGELGVGDDVMAAVSSTLAAVQPDIVPAGAAGRS